MGPNAGMDGGYGLGLMAIKLFDALVSICGDQFGADPFRHWGPLRLPRGDSVMGGDEFGIAVACGQLIDDSLNLAA